LYFLAFSYLDLDLYQDISLPCLAMSLNGLRSQVETHDKNQIETYMDESLVALDLGQHVSSSRAHLVSFHLLEICLLEDLEH
jgi:hypothetical protein